MSVIRDTRIQIFNFGHTEKCQNFGQNADFLHKSFICVNQNFTELKTQECCQIYAMIK